MTAVTVVLLRHIALKLLHILTLCLSFPECIVWGNHPKILINPLPTNDAFWRRQILAACYQLAQSVLKIQGENLFTQVGVRSRDV